MPILDLQQRITERGRIRLGKKVSGTTKAGKAYTRPAKSETFILSSHDRTTVEQAAAEWGGTVEEFDAGYRVDTGRTELDVILPPAEMSFSQWLELWGNKICHRRCDGVRETISDGPCQCDPDPRARECKTTTRLSVMLPDLPGFGLYRIETHGYYAATEIAGAVQAVAHLAPNTLVRARLVAAPREVVRFDRDGQPKTHKFVVPVLDLPDVRLRELIAPDGGVGVAIQSPQQQALTPVPVAELAAPARSVAEQIAEVRETPRRKNAAAPLPPTGLKPGRQVSGGGELPSPPAAVPDVRTGGGSSASGQSQSDLPASATTASDRLTGRDWSPDTQHAPSGVSPEPGGEPPTVTSPPLDVDAVEQAADSHLAAPAGPDAPDWFAGANRKARAVAKSAIGDDSKDAEYVARWEALVWAASGGTTTESKALTQEQHGAFVQRLRDVSSGRAVIVESSDPQWLGFTLEYREAAA